MLKANINKYLSQLCEITNKVSIQEKIIDFFKDNPKPVDEQIHAFAEDEKIEHSEFEEIVYEILGSFLGEGKSKGFDGNYDSKELAMGIKVEMEHTTNPLLAEKIAHDHLAEFSDYYTRLAKMEKQAKQEGAENED